MKEKRCGKWIFKDNPRCFDCGGKKKINSRRSNRPTPRL